MSERRAATEAVPPAQERERFPIRPIRWRARLERLIPSAFLESLPVGALEKWPLALVKDPSPALIDRYAAEVTSGLEQTLLLCRYGQSLRSAYGPATSAYPLDVLESFEEFPPGCIDADGLVRTALKRHLSHAVIQKLPLLPTDQIDLDQVADAAKQEPPTFAHWEALAALEGRLTPRDLLADILRRGRYDLVVDQAPMIEAAGIPMSALVRILADAGSVNALAEFWRRYGMGEDELAVSVRKSYAEGRYGACLQNADVAFPYLSDMETEEMVLGALTNSPAELLRALAHGMLRPDHAKQLFYWLVDNDSGYAVHGLVGAFVRSGVEPGRIAEALLRKGFSDIVAHEWPAFPPGCVDPTRIDAEPVIKRDALDLLRVPALLEMPAVPWGRAIDQLFNELRPIDALRVVSRLSPAVFDAAAYADGCLSKARIGILGTLFPALVNCGLDPARMFPILLDLEWGVPVIVRYMEVFAECLMARYADRDGILLRLSDGQARRLVAAIPFADALRQQRFDLVFVSAYLRKTLKEPGPPALDADVLRSVHAALRRDGRDLQARYLEDYAALMRIPLGGETISVVSPRAFDRLGDAPETGIHRVALEHYVDDEVAMELRSVAAFPDALARMSFRDRMRFESLRSGIVLRERRLTDWLRRHLFLAVVAEAALQRPENGHLLVPSLPDPEAFLRGASVGEVLEYLSKARGAFAQPGWWRAIGGRRWVQIAETAYALWATPEPSRPLLDRVFDMQHNGGSIFRADGSKIPVDEGALLCVLRAKTDRPSIASALHGLPKAIVPEQVRDELCRRLDEAKTFTRYVRR